MLDRSSAHLPLCARCDWYRFPPSGIHAGHAHFLTIQEVYVLSLLFWALGASTLML
jgi:hypothetical protein